MSLTGPAMDPQWSQVNLASTNLTSKSSPDSLHACKYTGKNLVCIYGKRGMILKCLQLLSSSHVRLHNTKQVIVNDSLIRGFC